MPISKHDKQALTQLFTDMGVPLITAMQTVESWGGEEKSPTDRASELAKLLNISVEFATKLTKKLEIRDSYTLEHIRGKIIRIVTPLIAEKYMTDGTIPSSNIVDDLIELFDVLLSFSDSVSPTQDDKEKYDNITLFIEATEPILTMINNKDTIKDTVKTLIAKANGLSTPLNCDDIYQSGLLRAVTKVFITSYNHHDGADMDKIWKDCDEKLSIIQRLSGFVAAKVGIETSTSQKPTSSSATPPADVKKIVKEKTQTKTDDDKKDDDDDGDFNPMSFFG
jgi:hypothetical protein